ncbi:hypothetical protein [Sphingopyxis sp. A083]|uniref:hypothetical protein n=1 Tax=Sphingopyxis sp. A083 TaxID=1759083 RepID=UPI000EA9B79E|nr:hypothetical protein [Sphingopyxis sp. A083]KAB2856636.1 MAG: hypothetical protein F9K41_05980 [Sphingopyxis terrae]
MRRIDTRNRTIACWRCREIQVAKAQAKGSAFARCSGHIQPLRAKAHMTQRDFGVRRQGRKVISRNQREGRRRGGQ